MREEYINILENKIVKRFKGGQQMSKSQVRLSITTLVLYLSSLLSSLSHLRLQERSDG